MIEIEASALEWVLAVVCFLVLGFLVGRAVAIRGGRQKLWAREEDWHRRQEVARTMTEEARVRANALERELGMTHSELVRSHERARQVTAELEADRKALESTRAERDFFQLDLARVKAIAVESIERLERLTPSGSPAAPVEQPTEDHRVEVEEARARIDELVRTCLRLEAEEIRLKTQVDSLGS